MALVKEGDRSVTYMPPSQGCGEDLMSCHIHVKHIVSSQETSRFTRKRVGHHKAPSQKLLAGAQKTEHGAKGDLSPALKPNGIISAKLPTCSGPITPFSALISPFQNEMSILGWSHCCSLEASNLSGFTDLQLERNFTSGRILICMSAISNLHDI